MDNILLIDVGSTYIKYCICRESGEVVAESKVPFPSPVLDDGTRYLVPSEKIFECMESIFGTGIENGCGRAYISVQMHGYVLMNEENVFSEYVSWRDKSGNTGREFLKNIDFDLFGTSNKKNLPLTKAGPENSRDTFFTLGSYITYRLTGNNVTHITDACASGLYYSETGECGYPGLFRSVPIAELCVTEAGKYNGISVYTPVGDHQASFLGSGACEDAYLINIGTAAQISCVAPDDKIKRDCEKRPYFIKGKRLYTVSGLVGGHSIVKNEDTELFEKQVLSAVKVLPHKNKALFGGGGSSYVNRSLFEKLEKLGISCEFCRDNIGTEGLKIMAGENRTKIGVMHSEIPFVNFPIIAKNSGLDFVILDNEHGAFDYSVIEGIITTANLIGMNVIIRVGNGSRDNITKLADLGAHGFLLPMTNTADDIKAIVSYAKYSPVGKRGVSTTRAHTLYNPPKLEEYIKDANDRMKIYAQIETKSGVEHLDEILAVNGVEGVFIGPNDLSMDLDCVGDTDKICGCIKTVAECCKKHGKPCGIITGNKKLIDCALESGASMVSVGSELNMLIDGCKKVRGMF